MGIQPRKKVIEQMNNFIQKLPKGDRELLEAMVEEEVLTFEKLLREPNRLLENRDENDGRRVDASSKKKVQKNFTTFIINKDIMFQETNCGNLSKNKHHN